MNDELYAIHFQRNAQTQANDDTWVLTSDTTSTPRANYEGLQESASIFQETVSENQIMGINVYRKTRRPFFSRCVRAIRSANSSLYLERKVHCEKLKTIRHMQIFALKAHPDSNTKCCQAYRKKKTRYNHKITDDTRNCFKSIQ